MHAPHQCPGERRHVVGDHHRPLKQRGFERSGAAGDDGDIAGAHKLPITIALRGTHEALAACDIAIAASGTATLEAALFQRPMVIAYNMAPFTWALMRRMQYQPWVGLPNILCGEFVVPELLQEDATPDNLAQAALNLLGDEVTCARINARFAALHAQLRQGMAARAGEAVARLLAA